MIRGGYVVQNVRVSSNGVVCSAPLFNHISELLYIDFATGMDYYKARRVIKSRDSVTFKHGLYTYIML